DEREDAAADRHVWLTPVSGGLPRLTIGVNLLALVLALVELVADQLPSAPKSTEPPGLIARMLLGGLSGAAVAASGSQSMALGAALGVAGGGAGAVWGCGAACRLGR